MLEILSFLFFIEAGYMPQSQVITYAAPEETINSSVSLYTELGATIYFWDILFVGGSVRTHIWPNTGGFWPHKADYLFEVGAQWGPVSAGFRHRCKHPVVPFQREGMLMVDEVQEELYFRVEGEI